MFLALLLALQAQTKFGTSVEVRVINVDVVVTDKAGHRVSGLTKGDFEVLEDGKAQTITNFYEVRSAETINTPAAATIPAASPPVPAPAAAVEAPRPRRFVIFVDNESLHPAYRTQFFASVRKWVDAQIRPGDQVSLVSWSRNGLQIAAPLTDDKAVLKAALDAVEAAPSPNAVLNSYARVRQACIRDMDAVRSARMNLYNAYQDCINTVRQETQVMVSDSRLLMNAMNVAMNFTAGAEGKKAFVLAGASLPEQPGAEIYRWANMLFAALQSNLSMPPAEQTPAGKLAAQREMVEKLAGSANAHGMALYTIDAPMVTDLTDIRSPQGAGDFGTDFLRMSNTEVSYGLLSSITGGMSFVKPQGFDNVLSAISSDLDSYYSIGYRPRDEIGRERAVVVRVKNRDYTVRARQSYTPKTAEEQMSDRVVANIYTPAKSDFTVSLRAGKPQPAEKGTFKVQIEINAPPSMTLLPEEGKLAGGFTTYVAVGTRQGVLSTLSRTPQQIVVPPAEEKEFRNQPIVFDVVLTIKGGENLFSVAVVDQVSRTAGFARTTITTP